MAVVADTYGHLFSNMNSGEFDTDKRRRSNSRTTSNHSGRSTPHVDRPQDPNSTPDSALRRRSQGALQHQQRASTSSYDHDEQSRSAALPDAKDSRLNAPLPAEPIQPVSPLDPMDTTSPVENSAAPVTPQSPAIPQSLTAPATPKRIQVRDLAHIQTLSRETNGWQYSRSGGKRDGTVQYEISAMPIENIIEMVAGLLTKITSTNDMQHEHLHRQMPQAENSNSISAQTSSVLAFHGKNVPSITILSYLSRINKYCPTSYEVFLSLLVYFDRMTEKVNSAPIQSLREQNHHGRAQDARITPDRQMSGESVKEAHMTQTATPPASGGYKTDGSPKNIPGTPHSRYQEPPVFPQSSSEADLNLSHFFVVDSFNIHRLVIAGVTCASKFFSDIFYTNSRYAKVGGLPLPELNHLELQFLLLNDFRLSVPVEELEAYGTMLVEFYAREALGQHPQEPLN